MLDVFPPGTVTFCRGCEGARDHGALCGVAAAPIKWTRRESLNLSLGAHAGFCRRQVYWQFPRFLPHCRRGARVAQRGCAAGGRRRRRRAW